MLPADKKKIAEVAKTLRLESYQYELFFALCEGMYTAGRLSAFKEGEAAVEKIFKKGKK